jgi:hypothetical protein
MPNRGLYSGVSKNTWQNYEPRLIAAGNGSVGDPPYGAGQQNRGRYLYLPPGLMIAQLQISRGVMGTDGTGDCYVAELPFPATTSGDIIGQAMNYKTVTATPWENFATVLVARPWTSLGGDHERWCEFVVPNIIAAGTGTVTTGGSGVASFTVTHNLGFAPAAADITFNFTSTPATAAGGGGPLMIQSITTTQFTVATVTGNNIVPASTSANYGWKIRMETDNEADALFGPKRPWLPSFDSIFFQVMYEPKGVA